MRRGNVAANAVIVAFCATMSFPARRPWLVAFTCIAFGCGGSTPPPAPPVIEAPPAKEPEREMRVEGQLGSMDPRAFDKAFEAVLPQLQRCHTDRLQQLPWLSGGVKFFLHVGEEGAVKWGYLEDTTLGDAQAEKCMLQVLTDTRWPAPRGGEAEVRKSIELDAPSDTKAPLSWASDEIATALVASNDKIKSCRGRVQGAFKATAYVVKGPPDVPRGGKPVKRPPPKRGAGNKGVGHVLTAGIAPPSKDGLESVDCLLEAVKRTPMPNPGGRIAKVVFSL